MLDRTDPTYISTQKALSLNINSEASDSAGSTMEQIIGSVLPVVCVYGTLLVTKRVQCGVVMSGTGRNGATNLSRYSAYTTGNDRTRAFDFSYSTAYKVTLIETICLIEQYFLLSL